MVGNLNSGTARQNVASAGLQRFGWLARPADDGSITRDPVADPEFPVVLAEFEVSLRNRSIGICDPYEVVEELIGLGHRLATDQAGAPHGHALTGAESQQESLTSR
jgi:hypothetical protein